MTPHKKGIPAIGVADVRCGCRPRLHTAAAQVPKYRLWDSRKAWNRSLWPARLIIADLSSSIRGDVANNSLYSPSSCSPWLTICMSGPKAW